jgi:hypothetical protein
VRFLAKHDGIEERSTIALAQIMRQGQCLIVNLNEALPGDRASGPFGFLLLHRLYSLEESQAVRSVERPPPETMS